MTLAPIFPDLAKTILMITYVFTMILLLKGIHSRLVKGGWTLDQASYITRKLVHLLAAGPVTLALPFVFAEILVPASASILLGMVFWLAKRRGKLMGWFQTRDNNNEITFMIAWGASIAILWKITGSPLLSILPAAYISIGDGVTGLVRVSIIGRREKHWSGNLAMLTVTLPLSMAVAGLPGFLSALASSIAEKIQLPHIDDNITITGTSVLILALAFA